MKRVSQGTLCSGPGVGSDAKKDVVAPPWNENMIQEGTFGRAPHQMGGTIPHCQLQNRAKIKEHTSKITQNETRCILYAAGRPLCAKVVCPLAVPPMENSWPGLSSHEELCHPCMKLNALDQVHVHIKKEFYHPYMKLNAWDEESA